MNNWLLLIYKVPNEPSARRVYVWRKLKGLGALLLHDSVWVLPATSRTREKLQWLATEIQDMEGEATLWEAQQVFTGQEPQFVQHFSEQVDAVYRDILAQLANTDPDLAALSKQYQQARLKDYFQSALGEQVREALMKQRGDEESMKWVTWENVGVDRIGCAWLIQRFIDAAAEFQFIPYGQQSLPEGYEPFDIPGVRLTHRRGHCTFHTMLHEYGLKNAVLDHIAQIIDEADVVQEVTVEPAAAGLDMLCQGIRRISSDDHQAIERGRLLYEALYAQLAAESNLKSIFKGERL